MSPLLDIIFSTLFISCCLLATRLFIFRSEQVTLDTSLVTITTGGYGDIVPVTPLARMLSVVEAISGHF